MPRVLKSRTPESVEREFQGRDDLLASIEGIEQSWREGAFDADDFLAQSRACDAHDVGSTPGFAGDLERALGSIRVRSLLLAPPLDLYNPASGPKEVASKIPGAQFVEIPSIHGHRLPAASTSWTAGS